MIILEGINGAGKTTLAKRLANDLDMTIYRFSAIPETKDQFWNQEKASMRIASDPNAIQDRCPVISDWVYAPINADRKPYFSLPRTINQLRQYTNCAIVWVNTKDLKPKDLSLTTGFLSSIDRRYMKIFEEIDFINFPNLYYDYTQSNYDHLLERLKFLKTGIEENI